MKMLILLCVGLFCMTQAQYLPLSTGSSPLSALQQLVSPCQQPASTCQTVVSSTPVVTTIIDNSVSNTLANAIQLLIVSNLIQSTMNSPCSCGLSNIDPLCDCGSSVFAPALDVIAPPCLPYDPIPPCEIIAPCEPVIEIIPSASYPEILPVPIVECGCGCDVPLPTNIGANFGPNFGPGCDCGDYLPSLRNILPNILPNIGLPKIGLPNIRLPGCGCNMPCGCDQCGPIIPDMYPGYGGFGMPNYAMPFEQWGYEPYPYGFGNPYPYY